MEHFPPGITPEQLLGREPVRLEREALDRFLDGRTALVTGAGGSIGSELCRQLARHGARRVVLLDICENGVFDLIQELGPRARPAIASVRDLPRLTQVFEAERPSLVLHAAAHKHVPLMEDCPQEAVKNNLMGTDHVLTAAARCGCERLVLISSDKAVRPASVMGATKRLAELMVQRAAVRDGPTVFTAVRFGNVLGSAGSVVPLFWRQIAAGGPVTVTDRAATRYFMSIPEAASLVLTAASLARGGELFVLEMGRPVSIDALARRMIELAGLRPDIDIDIRYTGLRPGEKRTEELRLPDEALCPAAGGRLRVVLPPPLDADALEAELEVLYRLARQNDGDALRRRLASLFPKLPPGGE